MPKMGTLQGRGIKVRGVSVSNIFKVNRRFFLLKAVKKINVDLKPDKNNRHFTYKSTEVYVYVSLNSFWAQTIEHNSSKEIKNTI